MNKIKLKLLLVNMLENTFLDVLFALALSVLRLKRTAASCQIGEDRCSRISHCTLHCDHAPAQLISQTTREDEERFF
jgi:hypothetical protein